MPMIFLLLILPTSCSVQDEVHKLKAEVAELDSKLIVVTQALTEATAAREEERSAKTAAVLPHCPSCWLTISSSK